jgi:hypothetical protein
MIDQRIKERFAAAVRWGREVAKQEEVLRQVEYRLRRARYKLQATEDDLLLLLPVNASTARLVFALTAAAVSEAVLEEISQS